MAKYKKKIRKSELKGWRFSETPLPEGIRATDVDRMAQKIKDILADSHIPDEAEFALLHQVSLLVQRVIAFHKDDPRVNQLTLELARHEDTLHRLGFKMHRDIIPLNIWITRRLVFQKEGLDGLLKQVENKMAKITK